jgi:hypothetical protein
VEWTQGPRETESANRIGNSDLTVNGANVNGKGYAEHVLRNWAHPVITNTVEAHETHDFSFVPKTGCQILGASVTLSATASGTLEGTTQAKDAYVKCKAKMIVFGLHEIIIPLDVEPRDDPSGKTTKTTTKEGSESKSGSEQSGGTGVTAGGEVPGVGKGEATAKDEGKQSEENKKTSETVTETTQKNTTGNSGTATYPEHPFHHTFELDGNAAYSSTETASPTLSATVELDASDDGWHVDSGASVIVKIECTITKITGSVRCKCGDKTSTYRFTKTGGEKAIVTPAEPASTPIPTGGTGSAPAGGTAPSPTGGSGVAPPTGGSDVAPPTSGSGVAPPTSGPGTSTPLKTARDLRALSEALAERAQGIVDWDLATRAELAYTAYQQVRDAGVGVLSSTRLAELAAVQRQAAESISAEDRARLASLQAQRANVVRQALMLEFAAIRIEAGVPVEAEELDALRTNARAMIEAAQPPLSATGEDASDTPKDVCYYDGKTYSAGSIVCAADKTKLVCNVPGGAQAPFWKADGTCP